MLSVETPSPDYHYFTLHSAVQGFSPVQDNQDPHPENTSFGDFNKGNRNIILKSYKESRNCVKKFCECNKKYTLTA